MSCWQQVLESDARSHAELTAGFKTLEKFPTLPAEGVAFLSRDTEGGRAHSVPKKFSVGSKRTVEKMVR